MDLRANLTAEEISPRSAGRCLLAADDASPFPANHPKIAQSGRQFATFPFTGNELILKHQEIEKSFNWTKQNSNEHNKIGELRPASDVSHCRSFHNTLRAQHTSFGGVGV